MPGKSNLKLTAGENIILYFICIRQFFYYFKIKQIKSSSRRKNEQGM